MKNLCLLGPVDKRAIAYPLLKVLGFLGRTLVITDDANFRRFAESFERDFGVANLDFKVVPELTEELVKTTRESAISYDYVLYLSLDFLPEGMDKVIYAHGVAKSFGSVETLKQLENQEYTEVFVTFAKPSDPQALKIEPSKSVMSYILSCEEAKEFLGTTDIAYATMLQRFFEKELDLSKNTLKSLLRRKG